MIENRFRLEREITRGRQSLRLATHMRGRDRLVQDMISSQTKLAEGTSSPAQASGRGAVPFPAQLSIESDAESSFAKGSPRFFKRHHNHHHHHHPASPPCGRASPVSTSGRSTQVNSHADPLTSRENQQRWATTLLESGNAESRETRTTQTQRVGQSQLSIRTPSPPQGLPYTPLRSPSFFSRLRKQSFATLPSSFSGFRRSNASIRSQPRDDDTWSSDSSSSEYRLDESERRLRHPSIILDGDASREKVSSDEYGNADDELRDDVGYEEHDHPAQGG